MLLPGNKLVVRYEDAIPVSMAEFSFRIWEEPVFDGVILLVEDIH